VPALTLLSDASILPITIVRGRGAQLFDDQDRPYWDFYGGHAVALLGQAHPRWVEAISHQASTLSFVTTVAPTPIRSAAIDALCDFTRMARAFLVNSGAEANEAALKIARKATGRGVIVAMEGGFHGRTMACLGVTHAGHYRSDHAPAHGSARFVPLGDASALRAAMGADVAAVILEPIQGIAGAIPAPVGFLETCRTVCDDHGAVLILDEVQTGIARTGLAMAWHAEPDCSPDLVTVGKSLGSGFPVAALLANEVMAATVSPGEHGTTFGGCPLAAAVVCAVLETIRKEGLVARAAGLGARIIHEAAAIPGVESVRGRGALLGVILDRAARPVADQLRDRGLLVGTAADPRCLRLCPPAIMPNTGVDALLTALRDILSAPPTPS
jgi:acetylornithine/succinyldiaminopimelate/putrescine aminotransferase